jgi:radical SAM superfamily enzyme YgiQ (UPF0313 family)
MKKILFVGINARYVHSNPVLFYLRKLSTGKAETAIAEYTTSQYSYDILADIYGYQPEIIAMSVYIWNSKLVRELLPEMKKILPETRIVLGGPEVSFNSQQWLDSYDSIDFIVTGGGEQAWLKLLTKDFDYPERIVRIPNLSLSEIPFPYSEKDIKLLKNRIIYYESSRGCPYHCSYCLSSREDNILEFRGWDRVRTELFFFMEYEVPLVKFVDRTFNADPHYARKVWSFLSKENPNTRFHFEINPYLLTEEDITLLETVPANLFQFEIGVQSTNNRVLSEINRQGEWPVVKEKIAPLLQRSNIPVHLDLIFGLPYDDRESARKSFNDIYALQPDHLQPGMLKVLPGTVLADKTQEYDLVYQQEAPYKVFSNKWISFPELLSLQNIEHLVNNLYNSHHFPRTLQNLTSLSRSLQSLLKTGRILACQ